MDEWVVELLERQRRLMEQLAAAPSVELTGLTDQSGVSGGKLAGETLSMMTVGLEGWRVGDGPLRTEKLTLRRQVPGEEITPLLQKFGFENIVRVRARVSEDNIFQSPQALFEEFLGRVEDLGLRAFQKRLNTPVVHDDSVLGALTWNRRYTWFEGQTTWNPSFGKWLGRRVKVRLEAPSDQELAPSLAVARRLWADARTWDERVRRFAVAELLELKNGTWLQDGEKPLTPEKFLRRMKLESISVAPDGTFEFWHNDGNLFWGHAIQICGSLANGPTRADIPG